VAKRSSLRASDADRDRVAERLRQAAAEGRILAQELEDRLATALRARTYGELDAVVADLPGAPVAHRPRPRGAQLVLAQPVAVVAVAVAVTLVAFVLAAVVLAGLFAFSGVWFLFVMVMFARRGHHPYRRYAHRGHRF
jgi:hypothetical protein